MIWTKTKLQAFQISMDQLQVNALQEPRAKKNMGVSVAGSYVLPSTDGETNGSPSDRGLQYQSFTV